MSLAQQVQRIACHDLDPDFIEELAIAIGWEYQQLFESLKAETSLTNDFREELFAKRRGEIVQKAMRKTAIKFGIPSEFVRLDCNGQNKLLVRAGRVILIQEPIQYLNDQPKVAEYKRQIASANGFISQYELDLGDRIFGARDWTGCILAVLLHGASGMDFARKQTMLGGLFLAVPDAAYSQWLLKLDLHKVAMFGRGVDVPAAPETKLAEHSLQPDNVVVRSKRAAKRGIG